MAIRGSMTRDDLIAIFLARNGTNRRGRTLPGTPASAVTCVSAVPARLLMDAPPPEDVRRSCASLPSRDSPVSPAIIEADETKG